MSFSPGASFARCVDDANAEPPEEHVDGLVCPPDLPGTSRDQMAEPDRWRERRDGRATVVRHDGLDEPPGQSLLRHRCLLVSFLSKRTLGSEEPQSIRNPPYGSAGANGSSRPCCNAKRVAVEREEAPI